MKKWVDCLLIEMLFHRIDLMINKKDKYNLFIAGEDVFNLLVLNKNYGQKIGWGEICMENTLLCNEATWQPFP